MSRTERYVRCLEIHTRHGYYCDTPPLNLVPDSGTMLFLTQSGWVFRRQEPDRWLLLRPEEAIFTEEFRPVFRVVPTDTMFYYVTERALTEGDEAEFEIVRQQGTWGVLTVGLKKTEISQVELRLLPPEKKLEFVLIPRHTDGGSEIRLREIQDKVELLPPEKITLSGIGPAYRIVTKDKMQLAENPEYRFQLLEVRDSGERLLGGRIPLPKPDESSVNDPRGTIAGYFYY